MTKYYETTITVKVLSQDSPVEAMSLEDIAYEIINGDLVGSFGDTVVVELSPKETAELLYQYGSQPEFFNLDDDGKVLDE